MGQPPVAYAQERSVGGHIGFGFPFVARIGDDVTTIADFYQMSLPVGINVSGPGRMYFDLEFPAVVDKPRQVNLTVNPDCFGAWATASLLEVALDLISTRHNSELRLWLSRASSSNITFLRRVY